LLARLLWIFPSLNVNATDNNNDSWDAADRHEIDDSGLLFVETKAALSVDLSTPPFRHNDDTIREIDTTDTNKGFRQQRHQ
jgi:hypothetical protein